MDILFSIIIPVYNNEQYLERAINSVLSQTYRNFELIIINDGSTDSSKQIVENLEKNEHRITLVSTENQGVSSARNLGIKLSRGEYILFLDSDDYIDSSTLSIGLQIINTHNPDLIAFDFKEKYSKHEYKNTYNIRDGLYDTNDIKNELLPNLLTDYSLENYLPKQIWSSFIKKSIIDSHNIKFENNLKVAEDYLFMNRVYLSIKSFYYIKGAHLYSYCQNSSSVTQNRVSNIWEQLKLYTTKSYSYLNSNPNITNGETQRNNLLVKNAMTSVINEGKIDKNATYQERLTSIENVTNDISLNLALNETRVDQLSRSRYFLYLLIINKQNLLILIIVTLYIRLY